MGKAKVTTEKSAKAVKKSGAKPSSKLKKNSTPTGGDATKLKGNPTADVKKGSPGKGK
jgi:hypothetical protein